MPRKRSRVRVPVPAPIKLPQYSWGYFIGKNIEAVALDLFQKKIVQGSPTRQQRAGVRVPVPALARVVNKGAYRRYSLSEEATT